MSELINHSGFEAPSPREKQLLQVREKCRYTADILDIVTSFYDGEVRPPRHIWDIPSLMRIMYVDWPRINSTYIFDKIPRSILPFNRKMVDHAARVYSLWNQELALNPYYGMIPDYIELDNPALIPITGLQFWMNSVGAISDSEYLQRFSGVRDRSIMDYYLDDITVANTNIPAGAEEHARLSYKLTLFHFRSLRRVVDFIHGGFSARADINYS